MEKVLRLYKYIDGINDIAFPNEKEQAIITSFRYDAKRMGAAPTISFSLMHSLCLDSLWDNKVYALFNGERFYVKQTPTSSYSSSDTRYKHEVELVSERFILDNIYFYDVVSSSSQDKPVSNSSKFSFFGNIEEYVSRLNNSLNKSNVGYSIVIDDDILSDEALKSIESQVTFEDQVITNALQEIYNVYKIPYYFVGKTIHVGYYQDNIDTVFKYGCDNSLISISKTNANSKVINKITGVGSSDNIPYYYPNVDEKGITQVLYNGREGRAEIIDLAKYRKVKLADKFVFNETIQSLVPLIDEDDYSFGDFRDEGIDGDGKQRVSIDFYYSFTLQQYENVEFSVTTTYEDSLDLRYEIFNPSGQYVGYYKEDKKLQLTGGYYQFVIRWSFLSQEPMIGSDDVIKNFVSQYLNVKANIVVDSSNAWTKNNIPVTLSDYGISVNSPSDGDVLTIERLAYIQPQPNLVPPIYRNTEGGERFYEAINGKYKNEQGNYYQFDNEYTSTNPREHIENFDDIKPTIKNVVNGSGYYIDEFIDFAYDLDDNDETDESGKFIHPYFFGKLRRFDGEFGFNLFDHAIDEGEMVVSMTSGTCGSCEFIIGVDEQSRKNKVQVDSDGNLVRDNNGNVRLTTPQDRQNDTKNNEVWIALKKDIQTFGVVMPNAGNNYRPKAKDKFVLLHIDLPQKYVEAAENALKDKLIKYMHENNFEKFNFSIAFSRIYFAENPTILANLSENSKIQIEYNKNIYDLYISSLSYSISNDSALPEVKVELEDALSISQNQITQVVESTKREIISSIDKNVFWGDIKGVPTWITSDKPRYSYSELSGRGTSDNSNDVWVVKKDAQGNSYVYTKLDVIVERGVTMYGTDGSVNLPSIYDGLPLDNDTIYWEETKDEEGNVIARILKSRGVGEGGVTPTLLGDLTNVGEWANAIATEDRIMVQKKDSSSWVALELSKIGGSASFENVKESGVGNVFTSFVLSDDKKTLTFVKDKTFAEKSSTLSGYGITDAYTKTEADNLLAKKWTQDDNKITNWDAAYSWGNHAQVGYFKSADFTKNKIKTTLGISDWALASTKPSYTTKEVAEDTNLYFTNARAVSALTETLKGYVTLSGTQTITGEKNFTGGLKVNGQPIVYNSDGYWMLDGDLIVTGGITMYANENGYTPSTITDAVSVDNITIIRQDGKLMVNPELVFGGGGGEISTVAWGNVLGKPSWITNTKPEYKYSEIKETPNLDEYAKKGTTLSAYGITDANINNGVITLGNNTITPLTQTLGDGRYVTSLGTSGNDLTWTKDGAVNKLTVPYAIHSAHTSYLRNYLGDYGSITDLNEPSTFKTSQYRVVYDFYDGNTANRPVTSNNASGVLTLFKGIHRTGGGQYMSQMAFPDKDAVYFRRASDGVFGDWKLIAFTDSDITGNAGTATALKDRRSLWGQWFDGKDNVSGDMTDVGSVTMDGQLSLNGITIKKSADGVLFVDGNLVVSGGVTMYGTDGTTAPLIWDDAPIANTNGKKGVASYDPNFFAVNNGVVTFIGSTGGGVADSVAWENIAGVPTWITDSKPVYKYTEIDGTPDLSVYATKGTSLSHYGITDAYTKTDADNNFVAKTTKDFIKVNGNLTSNVDFNNYYTSGSYNNTTGNGSGNSNAPAAYGLMLVFGDKSGYAAQLHVDSGNTSVKIRTRYIHSGSFSWKEWKELAYTTSNVESATRLETPRKIWGQDFDGTEDVSGALSGVTSISMNGSINNAITVISEEDGSTIKGVGHRMYFGGTGYANQSYYFRPLYGSSGATTTALYLQNASASSSPTFTTTHALRSDGSASHTGNLSVGGSVTVNGGKLTYDSTNKYWKLEGDLLVTGGISMFSNDTAFNPYTITDAVRVDNNTIVKDERTGSLMINPDIELGGGLDETALGDYLLQNQYAKKSDIDTRINNLVNGAPDAYDTLKEIADVLNKNVDSVGDIITTLGNKADKATTLAGYGITDAYTKSETDIKLNNYALLDGDNVFTKENNFTGGLKVNGKSIVYDSRGFWKLEGDLIITGGVTMFGNDSSFSPSTITQAVNVDGTTIINDGKKLMLNPDIQLGGGGVTDYNDLTGKPDLSVYALKTSLSSYQTKITSENKLDYGLISGTPTIPTNTNQLTNGAGFITSSGSITGNAKTATSLQSYTAVQFDKADNGGKPCYLLISDVTYWYGASTAGEYGIAGVMYGWRGGNLSGTCVQKMIAMCAYSKSNYELKTDVTSYVVPRIVKYDNKYYIALYMAGSGRSHYFIGKTSNLLSSFINLNCASDGTYSGLTIVHDTETMAMSGVNVASATKATNADYATTSGSCSGNALTATTATKLSTTSKTAWGNEYWNSDGVPTSITGDMSSVGNITSLANGTYDIGSSSNKWKNLWVGNVKYTDTIYLGFSSSYASIRAGGSGSQLIVDSTSVRTNSTDSARASLGTSSVPWKGLYSTTGSFSDAITLSGTTGAACCINFQRNHSYLKMNTSLNIGTDATGEATIMRISSSGYVGINTYQPTEALHVVGNILTTGGITMYSDVRKKTILNHVELSLKEVADAPLIEHYYNGDESKRTHVGSVAQYWAGLNDWFCKEDEEGFLTMEIQNAALASAISVARELTRYESKTDKQIKKLKKRIGELEEEIENLKNK